jgi:hypothetical protein
MKDNIINFPTNKNADIDPDAVLNGATGELRQVLVLGVCHNGDDWVSCHTNDPAQILLLIERFKFKLLSGVYDEE